MNWFSSQLTRCIKSSKLVNSTPSRVVTQTLRRVSSVADSTALQAAKVPSHVLTTYRQFPSLEPINFQPVGTPLLGVPLRRDLLWQAVVFELDAKRVGSRHVKGRSEMGYSRKKLRPQKYTGRARQGDRGSPIRHDGGIAHAYGPGRDLSTELPLQSYHRAMRIGLSHAYRQGRLLVVDGTADFVTGHTNAGRMFMDQHGFNGKNILFVVDQYRSNLHSALQDCKRVDVVTKEGVQIRDILKAQRVIIEASALKYMAFAFKPKKIVRSKQPLNYGDVHERIEQVQKKMTEEIQQKLANRQKALEEKE
jgi:large subunit ribosomal protein L4